MIHFKYYLFLDLLKAVLVQYFQAHLFFGPTLKFRFCLLNLAVHKMK
jgi:cell division protein FtsB